jgi:hypothetical protein
MKIISKRRDYYDSALAHGQDQTVVFVRNDEVIDKDKNAKSINDLFELKIGISPKTKNGTTIDFKFILVVFCGKTYRGVKCHRKTEVQYMFPEEETKVFFDYEDLIYYLACWQMRINEDTFFYWKRKTGIDGVKGFLDKQGSTELMNFCLENKYSILTIEQQQVGYAHWDTVVTANGNLNDYQFYKVFDAFQTYQELDMYVSGTLPQSQAMPINISDKDRIQQHGFDKFSFRKQKQK